MNNATATLRALKGPAASLILALLLHPAESLGAQRLATLTGYSDKPVAAGLKVLSDLGLAQNHARVNGWTATAAIRQAILGELPAESENLRLAPCSSSSSLIEAPAILPTTTTTTPAESEYLRLTPDWATLRATLVDDCATPRDLALKTIHSLIHSHREPHAANLQALLWLSYCLSDDGASIDYPGAFIPAKLRNGETCPSWHRPKLNDPLYRRIEAARSRLPDDD